MLVRSVSRCSCKLRTPVARTNNLRVARPQCRRFATPPAGPAPGPASQAGMLAPFVTELDKIAPSFQIDGSQVRVIKSPSDFYETLKDKIRHAERRIFLATLYIGKSEKELIATLQEALRSRPELKLSILTDALRGTREAPDPSCASLLAPLVAEFGPDRVEIRMYHTPNLTGLRKEHIPRRINEGWGLQHMKLYGVDDEIILSGANLSTDYFTNRQDRYHLFSSRDITDFFWRLHSGVASLSFLIKPSPDAASGGFEMTWPANNPAPSPLEDPKKFISRSTPLLNGLILPAANQKSFESLSGAASETTENRQNKNTSVYILAQTSQLLSPDTSTELPAITHVLKTLALPQFASSSWTFTAGYFNPAPSLTKLLLSTASRRGNTVITASPYANGFYGSKGVSGLLPPAYTYLAARFFRAVHSTGRDDAITLKEWRHGTVGEPDGWTYHAKGLWVTLPTGGAAAAATPPDSSAVSSSIDGPSITLVGSSNYTKRSYSLDLEAGALVVTTDPGLRRRLADEQAWLQDHARPVTRDDFAATDRRVRIHVRVAMWIVQLVGGAL